MDPEIERRIGDAASAISRNHGHGTMTEPQVTNPAPRQVEKGLVRAMAHREIVDMQDDRALDPESLRQVSSQPLSP